MTQPVIDIHNTPPKAAPNSDQSKFSSGVRDLENFDGEAEFTEFEVYPGTRRDPEESRYNEAGQPVFTQGDAEEKNIKEELKKESTHA